MKNKLILLSCIVPVYNVEEYLEECLDSLVTQDIPYDEYEIICIDDGSTDKSGDILDSYAEKYTNIVVIHKENGGVSSARNCGIDIARGQYIWFIDADDFIKDNCLSVIGDKIKENRFDTIRINIYPFNHGENKKDLESVAPDMYRGEFNTFSVTYIFKKEYIICNKIYFDTGVDFAEDAVFMLQLKHLLRNAVKIEDFVVYFYRQRPGSAMSYNLSKKIQSRINGALVCEEIIQGKRIGNVEGAYSFKYISVVKIMEMAIKLPKTERKEIVKELENKNLFPLKYNSKYTPNFRKGKTSITKKTIKMLCDFSYTKIGCFLLCAFVDLKCLLKRIVHRKKS